MGKHPERVSGVPTSGPRQRLNQPTYVTRKPHRRGTAYLVAAQRARPARARLDGLLLSTDTPRENQA